MSEEATMYDASHIQVLEGWEAVRKRPGMYIGNTGQRGLHQLVFEVAYRAVNEVLAGRATSVDIALTPDGGVRVADDGPGIPLSESGDAGDGPGLEALLTRFRAGVRNGRGRAMALQAYDVGPGVVNALSHRMTAEVRREGVRWVQEYARGLATTPLAEAGKVASSGTTLVFWPDAEIFDSVDFSFDALVERFRELAFLNRGLDISLTDLRDPDEARSVRLHFPGGARDFVDFLDLRDGRTAASAAMEPVFFEREDPRMEGVMDIAFRWYDGPGGRVESFANSSSTTRGTHVWGFRAGVAAALTAYARERGLLTPEDPDFDTDGILEGLTAVVSVKLDDPEFDGCVSERLGNVAVQHCVREAVQDHLGRRLRRHPEEAAAVIDRLLRVARRD
ncbi:DNA gyrase subunit B [Streptomyces sp. NPDC004311]|uniref:DNA gyrase subunit B n=1 Tax=Streptomyces sp. NPDC004311 TaxID=3364698 RepID=UPI0036A000BA